MDVKILYPIYFVLVFKAYGQVQNESLDNRMKILESKFEKVETLLEGLEQLCGKIGMVKGMGDFDGGKDQPNPKENGDKDANLVDFVPTIKVVSVESSGLVDDELTLTVIFNSENDCDIRWNVRYENSTFLAFKGDTQETMIEKSTRRLCTASITIPDFQLLEWLLAVLFGQNIDVQLSFNTTAIVEKGKEPLGKFEYMVLRFSPIIMVTDDLSEGIETTVEVTSNVIEAIDEGYTAVYSLFSYVNTTASPLEYNEVWSFDNDYLTLEIKNGSDNKLLLGVGKELAKFGGYLALRVEQRGIENKYLEDHHYGLRISFLNEKNNNIMPSGVIAIQKKEPIQYYRGQYHSLTCLGASIPTPNVALFKVKSDEKLKQLPVDIDATSDIFHSQVINFSPDDAVKPDGTYVCRVRLGSEFVDSKFTVKKHVEIEFDKMKTGVVKSLPEQTSISCKASGVPTPDFELRVNGEFGDDLMKSEDERFEHRVVKRKNNAKVTLTFDYIGLDISTIVCIAKQIVEGRVGPTKSFVIDIK